MCVGKWTNYRDIVTPRSKLRFSIALLSVQDPPRQSFTVMFYDGMTPAHPFYRLGMIKLT